MLSVDICQKCSKSLIHYVDKGIVGDEDHIICFNTGRDDFESLKLDSVPPSHCEYLLEHAVAAGMEKSEDIKEK